MDPDDRYHNEKCEQAVIDTHTLWRSHDEVAPSAVREHGAEICRNCGASNAELFLKSCPGFSRTNNQQSKEDN